MRGDIGKLTAALSSLLNFEDEGKEKASVGLGGKEYVSWCVFGS